MPQRSTRCPPTRRPLAATARALLAVTGLALSPWAVAQPLVVLDAGHGGRDPGAVGCGRNEAPNVLDVVQRMGPGLQAAGLRVALTRNNDTFVELQARAAFANERNAALFVSVHANSNAGAAATGSETWIANNASATSVSLANRLQASLIAAWGLRDRGVKRANFAVLTGTAMPAALTEIGFINNCNVDSVKVGDAAQRQRIADAQVGAIAAQLGVNAPPPGPATGVLRGVTFEDTGAGLDDPSIRLGGVDVRVGANAVRSEADTGAWQFTLAPGDYQVTGRLNGFEDGQRTCTVLANEDNWCSFGLRRIAPEPDPDPEPDPEPVVDQGVAPEPAVDQGVAPDPEPDPEPEVDFAVAPDPDPVRDAGMPEVYDDLGFARRDAYVPDDPNEPIKLPAADSPGTRLKGGCAATSGGGSGGALGLAGLLLLGLIRRRRFDVHLTNQGVASLAVLVLLGLGTAARAHVPTVGPDGAVAIDWFDAPTHPHAHLLPPVAIVAGDYAQAIPSPDARWLLLVSTDQRRLSIVATQPDATARVLVEGAGVGRHPRWFPDSTGVAVRTPDQSAQAVPVLGYTLAGKAVVPPRSLGGAPKATVVGDQVVWRDAPGDAPRVISPAGDRFFSVVNAPDGRHAVLWGLNTGLWLYRAIDGATVPIGPGSHPSFDPRGVFVVFERTADEGIALVGADLFLLDLTERDGLATPLTATDGRIELAPALTADRLAYIADGVVFWAPVVFSP